MTRQQFKQVAREGFKLTHLTDEKLDSMYDEATKRINDYKLTHPYEWAEAERANQEEDFEDVKGVS